MGRRNRRAIEMLAVTAIFNTILSVDSTPADSSETIVEYVRSNSIQQCAACQFPSLERAIVPGATRGERMR